MEMIQVGIDEKEQKSIQKIEKEAFPEKRNAKVSRYQRQEKNKKIHSVTNCFFSWLRQSRGMESADFYDLKRGQRKHLFSRYLELSDVLNPHREKRAELKRWVDSALKRVQKP